MMLVVPLSHLGDEVDPDQLVVSNNLPLYLQAMNAFGLNGSIAASRPVR